MWLNVSTTMWARLVRSRSLDGKTNGYVDDRGLRSKRIYGLQIGLDATSEFDGATLQEAHPVKTAS